MCSSGELFPSAYAIHSCAIKSGFQFDPLVSSALIGLYSKSGRTYDVRLLFDRMIERDCVLYNMMMKAYSEKGMRNEVFLTFSELHRSGTLPNERTFHHLIACKVDDFDFEHIKALGFKLNLISLSENVISSNRVLSDYLRAGKHESVVNHFKEIRDSGMVCDDVTFVVLLGALAGLENVYMANQAHGLSLKMGLLFTISISNSLINLYGKMGFPALASKLFDEMPERDLISWNSLISCFVQQSLIHNSLSIFLHMMRSGYSPDHFTLSSILRASSSLSMTPSFHLQIHSSAMKRGLDCDVFVATALINAYTKHRSMPEAHLLHSSLNFFDPASLNALISGYIAINEEIKALKLMFSSLRRGERADQYTLSSSLKACSNSISYCEGKQLHAHASKLGLDSDIFVCSSTLDLYIKSGDLSSAYSIFSLIPEPDDVIWTAMIAGCVENGDQDLALSLYDQMRNCGYLPDEFTIAALIKACSCLTAMEKGRQIHAVAIKLCQDFDPFVTTSTIDMYAKCGNLEDAYELFQRTDSQILAAWNAIILAFAQYGNGQQALNLFKKMLQRGLTPDNITFVGVLSACSHAGMVSNAREFIASMPIDFQIQPEIEHYSCLVDALGRAGLLQEAVEVIEEMPFSGSASMYRALLGACRIRGERKIGSWVANRLLDLDPLDSSAYVLLGNTYAASGAWEEAGAMRKTMRKRKVKKDPGYSWIEIRGRVHMFLADDLSHPAIAAEVEKLMRRIMEEGYSPDVESSLMDVEKEERERALYFHSERMAIAFGLISIPAPRRITVIKNLRVCNDCHNAVKLISKVTGREIILRDANRFHRFLAGSCSCGEYW